MKPASGEPVKMVSEVRKHDVLYEVYAGDVVIWRRIVDFKAPHAKRVETAREQERVAKAAERAEGAAITKATGGRDGQV